MIIITKGKSRVEFPDDRLPAICLELCGGGWSEKQTRDALLLKAEIETKGAAKKRGFTIEKA